MHVRVVVHDRAGHVLQQHGLAGLRRRHDQATLALADGAGQVQHAAGDVLGAAVAAFEDEALPREQRREVFEQGLVLRRFRRLVVDGVDLGQREVALAVLGRTDVADQVVAGAQVEAANLRRRDVDVVGTGQVAGIGRAQEAEAVRQDFQHAFADDVAGAGQHAQQLEGDVLLARAGDALVDAEFLGHFHEFVRRLALQFAQRDRRQLRAVLALRLPVVVVVVVAVATIIAVVAVAAATATTTAFLAVAAIIAVVVAGIATLAGVVTIAAGFGLGIAGVGRGRFGVAAFGLARLVGILRRIVRLGGSFWLLVRRRLAGRWLGRCFGRYFGLRGLFRLVGFFGFLGLFDLGARLAGALGLGGIATVRHRTVLGGAAVVHGFQHRLSSLAAS